MISPAITGSNGMVVRKAATAGRTAVLTGFVQHAPAVAALMGQTLTCADMAADSRMQTYPFPGVPREG